MKSIKLEISQSEVMPDSLFWKITSDGLITSGTLEISCVNDKARFLTCVAHVFTYSGVFNESSEVSRE